MKMSFRLPVTILKEKKRFVAYSPAIDLSTSGKNFEEVQKKFIEISNIFFEEIIKKNTVEDVLTDLGWQKIHHKWQSPVVVSQESKTVDISI